MATSAWNERELWDQARAAPRKQGSRKGKCQRRCSTSGYGLTRGSISLWLWHAGYALKWMIKASHLSLCFGALFVGSTRLGPQNFSRAWTNSSSNHITSNVTDHANSEPHKVAMMYLCTFTRYCYMYVSGPHSAMASQVTVWSDFSATWTLHDLHVACSHVMTCSSCSCVLIH